MNTEEEMPRGNVVLAVVLSAYADDQGHGDKLPARLKGAPSRRLVVVAYDDREIVFQGKKVVGPCSATITPL